MANKICSRRKVCVIPFKVLNVCLYCFPELGGWHYRCLAPDATRLFWNWRTYFSENPSHERKHPIISHQAYTYTMHFYTFNSPFFRQDSSDMRTRQLLLWCKPANTCECIPDGSITCDICFVCIGVWPLSWGRKDALQAVLHYRLYTHALCNSSLSNITQTNNALWLPRVHVCIVWTLQDVSNIILCTGILENAIHPSSTSSMVGSLQMHAIYHGMLDLTSFGNAFVADNCISLVFHLVGMLHQWWNHKDGRQNNEPLKWYPMELGHLVLWIRNYCKPTHSMNGKWSTWQN